MTTQIFQVRYNPMQLTSISAFMNINGTFRQGTKDVFFLRLIGCVTQETLLQDIAYIDEQMQQNTNSVLRILQFPDLPTLEQLPYDTIQWERPQQLLRYHSPSPLLQQTIQQRLAALPQLYKTYYPSSSQSMLKNFIIKILFWCDHFFPTLFTQWDIRRSAKFICSGSLKKQEYLFCLLLTQLGVDVLYFNPEQDLTLEPALLQLSALIQQPQRLAVAIPAPSTKAGYKEKPPVIQAEPTQTPVTSVEMSPTTQQPASAIKPNRAAEKSFEELAMLASSVVMIEVLDNQGTCFKTGSGILVHPQGYILTNFHVVSDSSHYRINLEGEAESYSCHDIIKYNYIYDLALLRIDHPCRPLPIYRGQKPLIRGQKVVAIGSPLGLFNSVSDGIISGFRTIHDTDMIQFTAPTSPGSSGGALLNMQGEVIGICTAGIQEGQNLNLAVEYQTILSFLSGFLP